MIGAIVATVGIAVFAGGIIAALATAKPADRPEPVHSNADWFQTLPWRDFVPVVPRLRMPRLLAPKRRGKHLA